MSEIMPTTEYKKVDDYTVVATTTNPNTGAETTTTLRVGSLELPPPSRLGSVLVGGAVVKLEGIVSSGENGEDND